MKTNKLSYAEALLRFHHDDMYFWWLKLQLRNGNKAVVKEFEEWIKKIRPFGEFAPNNGILNYFYDSIQNWYFEARIFDFDVNAMEEWNKSFLNYHLN